MEIIKTLSPQWNPEGKKFCGIPRRDISKATEIGADGLMNDFFFRWVDTGYTPRNSPFDPSRGWKMSEFHSKCGVSVRVWVNLPYIGISSMGLYQILDSYFWAVHLPEGPRWRLNHWNPRIRMRIRMIGHCKGLSRKLRLPCGTSALRLQRRRLWFGLQFLCQKRG